MAHVPKTFFIVFKTSILFQYTIPHEHNICISFVIQDKLDIEFDINIFIYKAYNSLLKQIFCAEI